MTEIIQNGEETLLCIDGKPYAKILSAQGAEDSFEPLETGRGAGDGIPLRRSIGCGWKSSYTANRILQ